MSMPNTTPQLVLQGQLQKLQRDYSQKEKSLPRDNVDPVEYNKEIVRLQKEFDSQYDYIAELGGQFDQTQLLVDAQLIPADRANEAMWRMILPSQTAQAMFDKPKGSDAGTPMSVATLTGKPMTRSITGFAEGAEKRGTWTSLVKDYTKQEDLIKQYSAWRDFVGYESRPAVQQRQLDIQWDDMMTADKSNRWNPKDPAISALRAKGPLTRAAAVTPKPGTPIVGTRGVSPFVTHIETKLNDKPINPSPLIQVMKPDGTSVRVPSKEWEKQKTVALSEGWKEI